MGGGCSAYEGVVLTYIFAKYRNSAFFSFFGRVVNINRCSSEQRLDKDYINVTL